MPTISYYPTSQWYNKNVNHIFEINLLALKDLMINLIIFKSEIHSSSDRARPYKGSCQQRFDLRLPGQVWLLRTS